MHPTHFLFIYLVIILPNNRYLPGAVRKEVWPPAAGRGRRKPELHQGCKNGMEGSFPRAVVIFLFLLPMRGSSLNESAGKSSSGFCVRNPKCAQLILNCCLLHGMAQSDRKMQCGHQGNPGRRIVSLAGDSAPSEAPWCNPAGWDCCLCEGLCKHLALGLVTPAGRAAVPLGFWGANLPNFSHQSQPCLVFSSSVVKGKRGTAQKYLVPFSAGA